MRAAIETLSQCYPPAYPYHLALPRLPGKVIRSAHCTTADASSTSWTCRSGYSPSIKEPYRKFLLRCYHSSSAL